MTLSANDWRELFRHMAEEVNVKRIVVNGQVVYNESPLADRYKEKQKQFDAIYESIDEDDK